MIRLLIFATFAGLAFASFRRHRYPPGQFLKYNYPPGGDSSRYSYLSGGVFGPFTSPTFVSRPGSFPRNPSREGRGSRFRSQSRYPVGGQYPQYPFPQNEDPYPKYPSQPGDPYPKYPSQPGDPYPKYPSQPGDPYPNNPYAAFPVPFPWFGPYRPFPNPWDDGPFPGFFYPAGLGDEPYCLPNIKCWTPFFDRDDPDNKGDWELASQINDELNGVICSRPTAIDVTTAKGESVASTGEVIFQKDIKGFICRNEDQPSGNCSDYRVRFACHAPFCDRVCNWTGWIDIDDCLGTGDYELLSDIRAAKPGEVCDDPIAIEAVTVNTSIPAIHTGDKIHIYCPSMGFVCRSEDQPSHQCHDYRVRFGCPCR